MIDCSYKIYQYQMKGDFILSEKYLIYLRKSRADHELEARGESETLARHEKLLTDYAVKNHLNISKIYKEIVSGESIAARPEIQKLLQDVETGEYAGVLVVEVERLARGDTMDQGYISSVFKYSDTKIITPSKIYDPNNEFDEEYFEFGLFMSRREYKTINRRIQRGRIASVNEGKYIASTAPYGYRRVKITEDKGYTLEICKEESDVVRLIFDLYTNGKHLPDNTIKQMGMSLIAKELDSMGIKPRIAKTWSPSSIKDILTNPVYIGKIRWSKDKIVKKAGSAKEYRRKNENFILVDGLHEAIIEECVFKKAAAILKTNTHVSLQKNTVLQNPLTGLVYCQKCSALMTRAASNTKTNYPVLKCPNRYCNNISAPLELIEEHVLLSLKEWADSNELDWTVHNKAMKISDSLSFKQNHLKTLQANLDSLNKQLDKTYTLLEREIYTVEIFQKRSQQLNDEISTTQKALKEAQDDYEKTFSEQSLIKSFLPKVYNVIEVYQELDNASAKNSLLREVIEKIEYLKTTANKKNQGHKANFNLTLFPKIKNL